MEKNLAQEEAIRTTEGQVLLISCPGSGKTTTMIRRIKAMIDAGIKADPIVMVTFTDAAATEMQERFMKNYGVDGPLFCTIHSLCLRILTTYGNAAFMIMSTEDQFRIIHDAVRAVKLPDGIALKDVLSDISAYKNCANSYLFKPTFVSSSEFEKIYPSYEKRKNDAGLMDFDDMLHM